MDMKKICKDTGYFFVGSSVCLAEKTAKGAGIAAKAIAKAARKMTQNGEAIAAGQKLRHEERKAAKAAALEIQEMEVTTAENPVSAEDVTAE